MKHLTDQQSVRAREWMRFKGEPFIRAKTAKYLADLINREDGTDCYTPAHMAARRQEIFPLRKDRPDRVAQLEAEVRKLASEVENLKRMVQQMRQGSVFASQPAA